MLAEAAAGHARQLLQHTQASGDPGLLTAAIDLWESLALATPDDEPACPGVADRLDITGSRWSVPGAEAVLTLRAVISNGDFPQYWTFRTHRERERLYPRPDQHNYELLA
ncbi:hypothetical protein GCM10010521_62090 [Streptomyces rameus]|uniref:Uncharacterized protein n=2 Tax=Streptomyces rameus TaxID=68261 RepID=A0ABN3V1T0_9ACTN